MKEYAANLFKKLNIDINIIIIAGYAIFFSIWNLTAPFSTTVLMLLSAFLVMLSALFFVAYRIYRIIAHMLYFRRLTRDPENNTVDSENPEIAFAAQSMKVGSWFVVPSLLSALSGTSIFIYQLFIGLFLRR